MQFACILLKSIQNSKTACPAGVPDVISDIAVSPKKSALTRCKRLLLFTDSII